jgi:hypothetical protein
MAAARYPSNGILRLIIAVLGFVHLTRSFMALVMKLSSALGQLTETSRWSMSEIHELVPAIQTLMNPDRRLTKEVR